VALFRPPRFTRAKRTELLLGVILGAMLLGLAVLANDFHIGPRSSDAVLSQIIAASVGRNWAYYLVSLTNTAALVLAANTSFGGPPCSLLTTMSLMPSASAAIASSCPVA
jgi:hypothetical protein